MKRWPILLFAVVAAAIPLFSRADIPVAGPITASFDAPGTMPVMNMVGQGACSMYVDVTGGTGTFTPMGSSDGGQTWGIVPTIGVQTATGLYGGSTRPYLTNFYVAVDVVSGTVVVTQTCSAASGIFTANATPTPFPTTSATPTPTPVPTPPTPTPSPTPSSCVQALASAAPLALYKFDETSGTSVADSSGHSYNATIKNAALVFLQQSPIATPDPATPYSYGYSYPGYVQVPATVPQSATYSVVAFINGTYSQITQCVLSYRGLCFGVNKGFLGWGKTQSHTSKILPLVDGVPYMVAATVNTGSKPYVVSVSANGGTLTSANPASLSPTPSGFTYINANDCLQGLSCVQIAKIDDLALFPYIVSQTQLTQFASFCGAPYPTPVPTATPTPIPPGAYPSAVLGLKPEVYYRLDEASGTTAADSSGNSYDATYTQPANTTYSATGLLASDTDKAISFGTASAPQHPGDVSMPAIPMYRTYTVTFLAKDTYCSIVCQFRAFVTYHGAAFGTDHDHPATSGLAANGTCCVIREDATHTLVDNTAHFFAYVSQIAPSHAAYVSVDGGTLTLVTTTPCCSTPAGASRMNQLTFDGFGSTFITGTVDEVAIFPRALTQAQITALAATAGYP